jgi:polyhydroxyalkanoate synthase subunit PhaC
LIWINRFVLNGAQTSSPHDGDIQMSELSVQTAENPAQSPRREPPATVPAASSTAETSHDLGALDRWLHAAEGRATFGLSPAGPWLAFLDWATHLRNAPFYRAGLAELALTQWQRLGRAAFGEAAITPKPGDHRFSNPAWQALPFNLIAQAFLLSEQWWARAAEGPEGVSTGNRRIVSFATRQLVDIFSPSNLPWLNPEVIGATAATGGRNLAAGFDNLLKDTQELFSGRTAPGLVPGHDVATTPGKVVLRNGLIELIQYTPTTSLVRPEPVLIVPAWIMKYYILDLSPQNSLIRYLVAQGYTVFAISWRNPGPEMHGISLDDYRQQGVMAALDAINSICGKTKVHACGYCIGGTLLSIAAATMARDADERLASVTLFCAQTDFTEAGELQLFITVDQLAFLTDMMRVQGYLGSQQMAGAFQLLRSNDLVWSRAIKNYLLGEREHPNDLMSWNADGTRMPARMHAEYLQRLFLDNDLAEGRFPVGGRPISIGDIRVPLFVVGTETDHIAPWHSVFKIHLLNEGDVTFVLTSGGHNAGVVSEPGHPHRHFRSHRRQPGERFEGPEEWFAGADLHEGSWWPSWTAWLGGHSGQPNKPPSIGSRQYQPVADAPGQYVLEH